MHKYEGMFLLDHGKVKNDVQKGSEEITSIIEKHGGKILNIGKWDERRLAYEINKQKRGTYVLAHIEAPQDSVPEINRDFGLSEIVSRQLFTRIFKEFPEFKSAQELEAAYGSRDYRDRSRRVSRAPERKDESAPKPSAEKSEASAEKPADASAEKADAASDAPAPTAADSAPKPAESPASNEDSGSSDDSSES